MGLIADNPGCTNRTLRGYLKRYGKEYAFTESILQESRSAARKQLFGSPADNVTYHRHVKDELTNLGHIVEMRFTTRRETLKNIEMIVLAEELLHRKHKDNSTMDRDERCDFIRSWKREHRDLLVDQLGPKDLNVKFLDGIFFTPSFSKGTVPELQRLFMAAACHLNFGKYTLYSCYGVTANSNMFPVAFAIIFGNENLLGWTAFWQFAVKEHPCLNESDVTIVTDQDKGLETAIADVVSNAINFHCSYHRSTNIIKMCGAKSGNRVYSALYVYNKLLKCRSVDQIQREKDKNFPFMHTGDLRYLTSLKDHAQYPAARCHLSAGTYMYHRTSSAGVESMNAVNREMRAKTAVDPLNACILLMKMECKRFVKQRRMAMETDTELTPRGRVLYDEVFSNVNAYDFTVTVTEDRYGYQCTAVRNALTKTNLRGKVTLLKEPLRGSYFGKCTCGVDTRDAVPCEHMAAVVATSRIPGLTRENIMPYWWRTEQWQLQFPDDVTAECNVSMETIQEDGTPNTNVKYCPSWSGPNKAGRPKKNERKKSVLEKAGVRKATKTRNVIMKFCQICHRSSHVANHCWELEKNADVRPDGWKSVLPQLEDAWDTLSNGGADDTVSEEHQEGTAD